MKQEDLIERLGLIVKELNEQYQYLAQNAQQLSELEFDLFNANANFLAEHVQIIKRINANHQLPLVSAPAVEVVMTTKSSFTLSDDTEVESTVTALTFVDETEDRELFVQEQKLNFQFEEIEEEVFKLDNEPSSFEFILNDHAEHEKFDFEEKSVDEIFNRPLSDEEAFILEQKKQLSAQSVLEVAEPDDDEIGPEPFLIQKEVVFPIVAEDLELTEVPVANSLVNKTEPVEDPTFKPTLNDLLAKSNATNINSTTGTTIKDLKQAINLNDKLLYIKDLFNGYNLAYAEAIDLANKLPNFESADNFFQKNYAAKNNWTEKQATVDKFYELLNQRFK
jgi:hypothetical protein